MAQHLLYSINPFLKFLVCQKFYGDIHYVWCSDCFDNRRAFGYSYAALVPPSSNPIDIFRRLKEDVERNDNHSDRIESHRAAMQKLAVDKRHEGKINEDEMQDIIYQATNAPLSNWRPVVYLIPRERLGSRIESVPASKRAGSGMEFIIKDLRGEEFEIIEF